MRNVVLMLVVIVVSRAYRDCVGSGRCRAVVRAYRVVKCLESVGRDGWRAQGEIYAAGCLRFQADALEIHYPSSIRVCLITQPF
jgi:hypothetical protein